MKMYPSRHLLDYMTEINRLFPKTTENDALQSPSFFTTSMLSPPNQNGIRNRSSSSTDTSPDIYPDITTFASSPEFKLSNTSSPQSSASDTPIGAGRRPIVGRKIFSTPEHIKNYEVPMQSSPIPMRSPMRRWDQESEYTTPPLQHYPNNTVDQKNFMPKTFYELFPSEHKQVQSPVKMQSTPGSSLSPGPRDTESRALSVYKQPNRSLKYGAPTSQVNPWAMCTFCRKNGETQMVYMTHKVKEKVGTDFVVTCPILRSHVCPTCGGTGDNAHTLTYCPVLRNRNHGVPLQSTTITLKNTRVKSNGRKRY